MKIKTQQKYKELLKLHYSFKDCDFIEENYITYTISKDNYMEKVRDVYEELILQQTEKIESEE